MLVRAGFSFDVSFAKPKRDGARGWSNAGTLPPYFPLALLGISHTEIIPEDFIISLLLLQDKTFLDASIVDSPLYKIFM
jgi:hypothetical protein